MKNLKKYFAIALIGATASAATVADLEKRVEELEFANYSNFFSWSGSLENTFDYATKEDKTNAASKVGGNSTYFQTQLFIDMESKPSDKLSFVGRMAMRKYWNDVSFDGANIGAGNVVSGHANGDGIFSSLSNGRSQGTGQPYIERAYVNYSFTNNLIFTIGRLPTIDGMPKHISSGGGQLGSYPALAFSAILDGAALTYKSNLLGGDLATRVIYTPLQYVNFGAATAAVSGSGPSNTKDSNGERVSTSAPMYSLMLDYNKKVSFAQNANFIVQYVKIDDAFFGATGTNTTALGGSISNPAASTLRTTVDTISAYLELRRIMNTGLTMSFAYATTDIESRGGLTAAGYNNGCANNTAKCKSDGSRYIVSARYDFAKFGFGAEYIDNGANSFTYDSVPRSPLNLYGTGSSTATHLYANYNIDSNAKVVLGYEMQEIDKTYVNSVFGPGTKADIERSNVYTRFITNF